MRANHHNRGQKAFSLIAGSLIASAVVPALHAQFRLGGSRPAVLAPQPAAPVQSAQGARKPAPSKPALNLTLVDPGPIGIETTGSSFSVMVPAGGMRTLTASPLNASDPLKTGWARVEFGGSTIYAAHIAIGQGWTTVFTLVNTGGSAPITGNLILTAQDGNPLNVSASDPGGPTLSPSVGPVALSGGLGGLATFQLTEGGTLKTIAGVLESPLVQYATIPVVDDPANEQFTGYAVANPGSQAVTVKIALVNADGVVVQDITPADLNPLGPGKQVAKFLFQDVPSLGAFKGSMVLRAQGTGKIVPVALVLKKGLVSAIPVIPEKAPNIPN